MRQIFTYVGLIALFLNSCSSAAPTVEATFDVGAVQTLAVETAVALLTQNAPTFTPAPTSTPAPTRTPLPTATLTPAPEPITLTGTGDSIVDFQKWDGAAIVHIKYIGDRNFIVQNYSAGSSDPIDLMVNVIGSYEGTLPLDLFEGPQTSRFEVKATGQWEIQVLPFDQVRKEIVPGTMQGVGYEVILIGGNPDIIKMDASQASRNFIITSYSLTSADLVANEIAPYTGTSILDPDTFLLVIKATGPWTLEITTK